MEPAQRAQLLTLVRLLRGGPEPLWLSPVRIQRARQSHSPARRGRKRACARPWHAGALPSHREIAQRDDESIRTSLRRPISRADSEDANRSAPRAPVSRHERARARAHLEAVRRSLLFIHAGCALGGEADPGAAHLAVPP